MKEEEQTDRNLRLDAIGDKIAELRDEAVECRKTSGFEQQWQEDEDYYSGLDEHNRDIENYIKPRSVSGGLRPRREDNDDTRCTAFANLTRQFVDSASARACDILLPPNEWNFTIKPTPVPEFDEHEEDDTPMLLGPDGQPTASVGDVIKDRNKRMGLIADKSKRRIQDWLTECFFKSESAKVIEGGSMVGVGIMKGPVPDTKNTKRFSDGALIIEQTVQPVSKRVDHWDFYPDMNCGENIQDGDYVFERDHMTARQLRALKGSGLGYIDESIDRVLKEGPNKDNTERQVRTKDTDKFAVWYYYGNLKIKDLMELDDDCVCEEEEMEDTVPVVAVLVNDTVIKGYASPFETDGYPFDVFVWQRVSGQPFGVGVARQARTAQRQINAAFRALMDNMGASAIPMLGIMRGAIEPADGDWKVRSGKLWYLRETSGITDLNQAIQSIELPTRQEELQAIIELGARMMEDATGVSTLLQGDQGDNTKTVGGMSMLHENASSLLRRYTRNYDNQITIPHITRYYDYLLSDPEVPDEEKGDLDIEAVGSTHLVERHLQTMQLPMILQLSQDPRYEKSPKKTFDEVLRAYRFDPAKFEMDEEEKQALQQQQEPPAPQVQAAQIRAETDLQKAQLKQQSDMQLTQFKQQADAQKVMLDVDRDTAHLQSQAYRDEQNHQYLLQKLEMETQLAMLQYANAREMNLEDVKAKLAETTMKLSLQKELAMNPTKPAEQVATPIAEPIGRAQDGKAFQQ